MNITEFLDMVNRSVRRGDSLNTEIATAFVSAVRFIERNWNFHYMRRTLTQTVTDSVSITGTDAATLKSIQQVRWQDDSGVWYPIVQVDPDQIVSDVANFPEGYLYSESTDDTGAKTITLTFDAPFAEATEVEVIAHFFTQIDLNSPGNSGIWLLNHAEDAVLHRTMINMAPIMRDMQLLQMYNLMWQESQKTLMGMAAELEQGNR